MSNGETTDFKRQMMKKQVWHLGTWIPAFGFV
jgi:hypothetical protein